MRTRTSTSTRFNLKFLRVFSKKKKPLRKASFYFFHQKKLVWLFILKQVKPSPDSKMIKLLTFILITCCRHKTSRRMTTAITFSRQLTRTILSIETISCSQSSSSSNLKLSISKDPSPKHLRRTQWPNTRKNLWYQPRVLPSLLGHKLIVYNHFAYHLYQLSGTVKVDNW